MILIFGRQGQVATALTHFFPAAEFISSQEFDFRESQNVFSFLDKKKPSIIINAAAYTQVDKAEADKETALKINAKTPGQIAVWCKQNDAILIHYSTDYVFDGSGERPWIETDKPCPINHYGLSKSLGDEEIRNSGCKHYIFRVSWVYSDWGQNFKKTILRLAAEREELKIVNDQWGAPTHALQIAEQTFEVFKRINGPEAWPFGIYHLRFSQFTTWYNFANSFLEEERLKGQFFKLKRLIPISSKEYPTPAPRPLNSRLSSIYSGLPGQLYDAR